MDCYQYPEELLEEPPAVKLAWCKLVMGRLFIVAFVGTMMSLDIKSKSSVQVDCWLLGDLCLSLDTLNEFGLNTPPIVSLDSLFTDGGDLFYARDTDGDDAFAQDGDDLLDARDLFMDGDVDLCPLDSTDTDDDDDAGTCVIDTDTDEKDGVDHVFADDGYYYPCLLALAYYLDMLVRIVGSLSWIVLLLGLASWLWNWIQLGNFPWRRFGNWIWNHLSTHGSNLFEFLFADFIATLLDGWEEDWVPACGGL